MRRTLLLACLAILASSSSTSAANPSTEISPADAAFFEKSVRPLLIDHCYACHGPDKQKGGLRLDSREAALTGGDSGPAIIAGKPANSQFMHVIRYDGDLKMPPKQKLDAVAIEVLGKWIERGAPWPASTVAKSTTKNEFTVTPADRQHWAFRPIGTPKPPTVKQSNWIQSPIDAFILAPLEAKQITPAMTADKRTLIRRIAFDLTGLPPTTEEVAQYLADKSPNAYASMVDRYLASPRFGERWARHWLDVARYGEDQAHTFQARQYPDGFRYRDYLIDAYNADKPYDQFIREQIAGDLLPDSKNLDRYKAVGFFALGPVYYGSAPADEIDDRIDTLTRGFLGLTVSCARCHDHKFDPIGTSDYYALAGVFGSTDYREVPLTATGEIDTTPPPPKDAAKDKAKEKDKKKEPRKPVIHALKDKAKPANARINVRGNPANLGAEVPRQFIQVLCPTKPTAFMRGSGRLDLADAIADPNNPLTARVMVNRVWAHLFGRGIVATPSNFGRTGAVPTHPELLDWLAKRFIAEKWSVKQLIREIMKSHTYQMSPQASESAMDHDTDNQGFSRQNRKRLEVEPFRDAMLAVAGGLDSTIGGPSIDLSNDSNQRRTLYGAVSRHNLDPLLRLFDFPDPNVPGDQRAVTTVPLQQLYALNSPFVIRQSKAFAAKIQALPNVDDAGKIRWAIERAYARPASPREIEIALQYINTPKSASASKQPTMTPWERFAQVLMTANEFQTID